MDIDLKGVSTPILILVVMAVFAWFPQMGYGESRYMVVDLLGGLEGPGEVQHCLLNNSGQAVFSVNKHVEQASLPKIFTYKRGAAAALIDTTFIEADWKFSEKSEVSLLSLNETGVILGEICCKGGQPEPFAICPDRAILIRDEICSLRGLFGSCEFINMRRASLNDAGDICVTGDLDLWGAMTVVLNVSAETTLFHCVTHSNHLAIGSLYGGERGIPLDCWAMYINNRRQVLLQGKDGGIALYDLEKERITEAYANIRDTEMIGVGLTNLGGIIGKIKSHDPLCWSHFVCDDRIGFREIPKPEPCDGVQLLFPSLRIPFNQSCEFIEQTLGTDGKCHGFFSSQDGNIYFEPWCVPLCLNNKGQVFLKDLRDHNNVKCYLWSITSGMLNLCDLLDSSENCWSIRHVYNLNDVGEMLALAFDEQEGDYHLVMLVPTENGQTQTILSSGLERIFENSEEG